MTIDRQKFKGIKHEIKIWFYTEEWEQIAAYAKKVGKSYQQFIRDTLIDETRRLERDEITRPWSIAPKKPATRRLARVGEQANYSRITEVSDAHPFGNFGRSDNDDYRV